MRVGFLYILISAPVFQHALSLHGTTTALMHHNLTFNSTIFLFFFVFLITTHPPLLYYHKYHTTVALTPSTTILSISFTSLMRLSPFGMSFGFFLGIITLSCLSQTYVSYLILSQHRSSVCQRIHMRVRGTTCSNGQTQH